MLVASSMKNGSSTHPLESADACGHRYGHVPGGDRCDLQSRIDLSFDVCSEIM